MITIGTTDACSLDNIKEVHEVIEELAKKYPNAHRPHLHVDAAIGWAFSFYNNYDLKENKLSFRKSMIEKLAHIQSVCQNFHLADSITLDIHKTGFAPYSSSFVIIKNKDDFKTLSWDSETLNILTLLNSRYHQYLIVWSALEALQESLQPLWL